MKTRISGVYTFPSIRKASGYNRTKKKLQDEKGVQMVD
jgi:hypothetical protein